MIRVGTELFGRGLREGSAFNARIWSDNDDFTVRGWREAEAWTVGRDAAQGTALASPLSSSTLSYSKSLTYSSVYATALPEDAVGGYHPTFTNAGMIVTSDEAGSGKGVAPGNPVIAVDAATHRIGTLNTIGDQDYYQVELVAGHSYQIGMYGYAGGPNLLANPDSYVEVYGADGTTLLGSGDGGANTPANNANSGLDVLMTFVAPTTGTYYINARAFDQDATNGTTGDTIGDYEIFVHDATNDPNVYHPRYTDESPLYAIDWGTRVNRVNQTAANPDGNEGTRDTGNAQGTPTYGSALDMNAILAFNHKTAADIAGKNVITIYFARAGEIITSAENPTNPGLPPVAVETSDVSQFEHDAVMTALHQFEKVADVVYLEVQSKDQADFEYASYKGTPGPGISLLGSMEPPDEPNEGLALFNSGDYRWNATDLQQGGFSFVTLIHEIGHGHGLAHPHDNGGHSGIMHGVKPEGAGVADYTTGDFALNQGVFTMMSYEDGWQSSPYGNAPTSGGYGYLGGLMAFDIAAIQDKYGVNEDWATGNDVYTIKDVNAPGTYYTSIWDAGGIDEINYVGARDTTIDLRAATLKYEVGGGGNVSFAYGIFGGFTIANGVTIENATSDAGNDTLRGNEVANILKAGAGTDSLYGGGGDDTLDGGTGADHMEGGTGNDVYLVDDAGDVVVENAGEGIDEVRTSLATFTLAANVEKLTFLGTGASTLHGNGLDNVITGGSGNDFIYLNDGGNDDATGGTGNDVFLFGAAMTTADKVDGGAGTDQVALQGDYWTQALTFGAGVIGIESLSIMPGSDTRFGDDGTHSYSYNITSVDQNVAAGAQLTIDANRLRPGENFTFNGSAETDGNFLIYGGMGVDTLTGGAKNDVFLFGADASGLRWGASDTVDGGAGLNQLSLRGNYTVSFGADQIHNIISVGLLSALDTRFGALGDRYNYNITMNDGNLVAGRQMTIDAGNLRGGEAVTFDGSAELDGSFRVFGGQSADHLTGSQGNDILVGSLGGDWLDGQGGNDTFRYRSAADSSSTHFDTISGFDGAHDVIDLPGTVSGWGSAAQGTLSDGTFDSDLAAALQGHMGANQAVLFTADAGQYSGQTFLVVDGDGDGAYTADHDYVIHLVSTVGPIPTSDTHIFV